MHIRVLQCDFTRTSQDIGQTTRDLNLGTLHREPVVQMGILTGQPIQARAEILEHLCVCVCVCLGISELVGDV